MPRWMLFALLFAVIACASTARSAALVPDAGSPSGWSDAQAITALRDVLRTQPFLEDAVEGPMVVRASDDHAMRQQPVGLDGTIPGWPEDAWLVETNAGRWWVWPGGEVAPADRTGAALAAHLPTRPSFDHVVDWP